MPAKRKSGSIAQDSDEDFRPPKPASSRGKKRATSAAPPLTAGNKKVKPVPAAARDLLDTSEDEDEEDPVKVTNVKKPKSIIAAKPTSKTKKQVSVETPKRNLKKNQVKKNEIKESSESEDEGDSQSGGGSDSDEVNSDAFDQAGQGAGAWQPDGSMMTVLGDMLGINLKRGCKALDDAYPSCVAHIEDSVKPLENCEMLDSMLSWKALLEDKALAVTQEWQEFCSIAKGSGVKIATSLQRIEEIVARKAELIKEAEGKMKAILRKQAENEKRILGEIEAIKARSVKNYRQHLDPDVLARKIQRAMNEMFGP